MSQNIHLQGTTQDISGRKTKVHSYFQNIQLTQDLLSRAGKPTFSINGNSFFSFARIFSNSMIKGRQLCLRLTFSICTVPSKSIKHELRKYLKETQPTHTSKRLKPPMCIHTHTHTMCAYTHSLHPYTHTYNSHPQDLRHCSTPSSFKAKLKTFLFSQYFHPN